MATPALSARGYLPVLDGVRGLGILAVMLVHFVAHTTATNGVEAAVYALLAYGGFGVDLFFILSGFLITGILYDTRHNAGFLRTFWMRRALRIVPLYYAVLAVVFLVVPLFPAFRGGELEALRPRQEWAWLYGVNAYLALQDGWALSYIQHFWTLAVETHFYLLWPLVVWALADRPRALMRTALVLAALSFGGRVAASLAGVNPVAITVLTPFQFDALCLGGFFAVLLRQPGGEAALRRSVMPVALAAATVLVGDFAAQRLTDAGRPLMLAMRSGIFRLLLGALLLHVLFAPASSVVGRVFRSRLLTALGKYSYGIYVYHHFLSYYFVIHGTEFALARAVGSHTLAVVIQAAVGMAVSIAAGWLSFEYFEKRFLELKRYWPSSRTRRPVVAPAAVAVRALHDPGKFAMAVDGPGERLS